MRDLLEHLLNVCFGHGNAQTRIGFHFGEALPNLAGLGQHKDRRLFDLVAVLVQPAGKRPPFRQRERQHLGLDLFHAHG